jgi:hypothetical protein
MPEKKSFGVLYFYDENPKYHEMAELSIHSLQKFHPDLAVEVIRKCSFPVPFWKKIYRFVTPWKNHLRFNRAGQDPRVFVEKAKVLCTSPYSHTLFLDVDTVLRKSLTPVIAEALFYDFTVCAIPWLKYHGIDHSMPDEWPAVNVGVMIYSEKFARKYQFYINKYKDKLADIDMVDQYFASLICFLHADVLKINYMPHLQIDVIDAHHHLNSEDYHVTRGVFDPDLQIASNFFVFHYNEYKPQYLSIFKAKMNLL